MTRRHNFGDKWTLWEREIRVHTKIPKTSYAPTSFFFVTNPKLVSLQETPGLPDDNVIITLAITIITINIINRHDGITMSVKWVDTNLRTRNDSRNTHKCFCSLSKSQHPYPTLQEFGIVGLKSPSRKTDKSPTRGTLKFILTSSVKDHRTLFNQ